MGYPGGHIVMTCVLKSREISLAEVREMWWKEARIREKGRSKRIKTWEEIDPPRDRECGS